MNLIRNTSYFYFLLSEKAFLLTILYGQQRTLLPNTTRPLQADKTPYGQWYVWTELVSNSAMK